MALATVVRIEKSDPYGGSFVANLAADLDEATYGNKASGVGLNSSGAVVQGGGGQTGIVGLIVPPIGRDILGGLLEGPTAGDPIDVLVCGEIINFKFAGGTVPGAGTKVFASPAGVLSSAAVTGSVYCGHIIESNATNGARFYVNVNPYPLAP
jgi:hypothetical protein